MFHEGGFPKTQSNRDDSGKSAVFRAEEDAAEFLKDEGQSETAPKQVVGFIAPGANCASGGGIGARPAPFIAGGKGGGAAEDKITRLESGPRVRCL